MTYSEQDGQTPQQFRRPVRLFEGVDAAPGRGTSGAGQFKLPAKASQEPSLAEGNAALQQATSQLNIPVISEQDVSLFEYPTIEGQGNPVPMPPITGHQSLPQQNLPVTGGQAVPQFRLPVTGRQNVPAPQPPGRPVQMGQQVPDPGLPTTGGQVVPPPFNPAQARSGIFRPPTIGELPLSLPSIPVPTMIPSTGQGVVPPMSMPSMPIPSVSMPSMPVPSMSMPSMPVPVMPPPMANQRSTPVPAMARSQGIPTPPASQTAMHPRLEKGMPFLAVVVNLVLVFAVVWLTQHQVFMSPGGIAGNLTSPFGQTSPLSPLKPSLNNITNNKAVSPLIFGTNMALFHDDDEPILNSPQARQLLKDIGVRVIRMPTRTTLKESTQIAAAQAVKDIGAVPLAVIGGPEFKGGSILQDDEHFMGLYQRVFGNQPVYYEFGNESDLNGIKVDQYVQVWNQVVPRLKQEFPNARFIAPDNYQFTRLYLKTFLQHANPLPDGVSWHEYTCSVNWTAAFCLSLLDTWPIHIAQARAAMHEAIGKELPIWITEWNYVSDQEVINGQPISDGKYNNQAFMQDWTTKAMQTLIENRVYASMQYYATDAPMPLINNGQIGIEGKIFQQEYKSVMVNGMTPPQISRQPPTPKPTLVPGQSYSFEDGGTAGWMAVGAGITQPMNSTARAFTGTHSLMFHLTNANETDFPYLALNADMMQTIPKPGQMISTYFYVANKAALVNAKIFVAGKNYSWHFAGDLTLQPGSWSRIWYSLPMNYSGTVNQIGIQLYTSTPGVPTDVYMDSFNWS